MGLAGALLLKTWVNSLFVLADWFGNLMLFFNKVGDGVLRLSDFNQFPFRFC